MTIWQNIETCVQTLSIPYALLLLGCLIFMFRSSHDKEEPFLRIAGNGLLIVWGIMIIWRLQIDNLSSRYCAAATVPGILLAGIALWKLERITRQRSLRIFFYLVIVILIVWGIGKTLHPPKAKPYLRELQTILRQEADLHKNQKLILYDNTTEGERVLFGTSGITLFPVRRSSSRSMAQKDVVSYFQHHDASADIFYLLGTDAQSVDYLRLLEPLKKNHFRISTLFQAPTDKDLILLRIELPKQRLGSPCSEDTAIKFLNEMDFLLPNGNFTFWDVHDTSQLPWSQFLSALRVSSAGKICFPRYWKPNPVHLWDGEASEETTIMPVEKSMEGSTVRGLEISTKKPVVIVHDSSLPATGRFSGRLLLDGREDTRWCIFYYWRENGQTRVLPPVNFRIPAAGMRCYDWEIDLTEAATSNQSFRIAIGLLQGEFRLWGIELHAETAIGGL